MEILRDGTMHGIYPWNEPRMRRTTVTNSTLPYYGCDNSAQIALCLGCDKEECINCIEPKKPYVRKPYKPRTLRSERKCRIRETFKQLYEQGLKREDICQKMEISRSTFIRYARDYAEFHAQA